MSLPERRPATPEIGVTSWFPESEADRVAILNQLDRILTSPAFASSKRYPNLLKYIVHETLAGRADHLKERTIGIDVFGRDASYDTNLEPVVRTSAAQVRQRMAQYYLEPEHAIEFRIELLAGSYIPQFRQPDKITDEPAVDAALPSTEVSELPGLPGEPTAAPAEPTYPAVRWQLRRLVWAAAAILALAALAAFARSQLLAPDPVAKFWGPEWDKANPVVICVPGRFPTAESAAQAAGSASGAIPAPLSITESLKLNSIAFPDATTLYTLAGFIQAHGQAYHVRRAGDSALSDLRTGPVVLLGGLNNPWLMRLTSSCRFTYQRDPAQGAALIQDSENPSQREWKVLLHAPYSTFEEDYGIISRVWDSTTERVVVVASGIASYGTIAAGEFLTNPKYLAMVAERAPKGWERKSVQVVFSTRVFNGNAGPPRVLAVHVW